MATAVGIARSRLKEHMKLFVAESSDRLSTLWALSHGSPGARAALPHALLGFECHDAVRAA